MNKYSFLLIFGFISLFGCIEPTEVTPDENNESKNNITNEEVPKCGEYELGETWETYDGCNTCNCVCEPSGDSATPMCACTEMYCPAPEEVLASDKISYVQSKIDKYKNITKLTEESEAKLDEAIEAYEEGDYELALELAEEADELIQNPLGNTIQGKTLGERLELLIENLYMEDSGDEAKFYFPDLEAVFIDGGQHNPDFPVEILPFVYYYSEEADITIGLSNIDSTVFVCAGKIDYLLQESEYGNCQIADQYLHPENY